MGMLLAGPPFSLPPLSVFGGWIGAHPYSFPIPVPCDGSLYYPYLYPPQDAAPLYFFSFVPSEDVVMPMLAPGKLHSFWTMLYSGMWFDTEPYFLSFHSANGDWWQHYYAWYRGEEPFPGRNPLLSRVTMFSAAGLILLGLVPLALVLFRGRLCVSGKWKALFKASTVCRASMS